MAELQRIVGELESDSLDVDELTARVERAAVLVGWCRERIDGTRFAVSEILERFDAPGQDDRAGTDGSLTAGDDGEAT
jgi:exodeoxyribonuclease VII small subunit